MDDKQQKVFELLKAHFGVALSYKRYTPPPPQQPKLAKIVIIQDDEDVALAKSISNKLAYKDYLQRKSFQNLKKILKKRGEANLAKKAGFKPVRSSFRFGKTVMKKVASGRFIIKPNKKIVKRVDLRSNKFYTSLKTSKFMAQHLGFCVFDVKENYLSETKVGSSRNRSFLKKKVPKTTLEKSKQAKKLALNKKILAFKQRKSAVNMRNILLKVSQREMYQLYADRLESRLDLIQSLISGLREERLGYKNQGVTWCNFFALKEQNKKMLSYANVIGSDIAPNDFERPITDSTQESRIKGNYLYNLAQESIYQIKTIFGEDDFELLVPYINKRVIYLNDLGLRDFIGYIDISNLWLPIIDVIQEMDSTPKDNEITEMVSTDVTETVEMIHQAPISDSVVLNDFSKLTVIDESLKTDAHLMTRNVPFASFVWSTGDQKATSKLSMNLPTDIFKGNFLDLPNANLLRNYRFFNFGMELTFVTNATHFHCGQLLASWTYLTNHLDGTYKTTYDNLYARVQRPHCFIAAQSNTVAKLIIPFKYIFPMVNVLPNRVIEPICTLDCDVYNQLQIGADSCPGITVNVFVKFVDIHKSGLFYNLDTVQEMETIRLADKILHQVLPDLNRDNPTDPKSQPAIVPYGSHSWSIGTQQNEITNLLKLDAKSTTNHLTTTDELQVDKITRVFGGAGTYTFSADQERGSRILLQSVGPMNNPSITQVGTTNTLPHYAYTPLGVISSFYAYWRGEIEYRFDFVIPFSNTARVLAVFYPTYGLGWSYAKAEANCTFDRAQASYNVIFEIGEITSFTFTCPYTAPQTFLQTSDNIGYLGLFVLNALCPFTNTANNIPVNLFKRAGSTFELAVPRKPLLSPAYWDSFIMSSKTYLLRAASPSGLRTVYYKNRDSTTTVIPYLVVSDVPFDSTSATLCYIQRSDGEVLSMFDDIFITESGETIGYYDKASNLLQARYFVPLYSASYQNSVKSLGKFGLLAIFSDQKSATSFAKEQFLMIQNGTEEPWKTLGKYLLTWYKDGPVSRLHSGDPVLVIARVPDAQPSASLLSKIVKTVDATQQADDRHDEAILAEPGPECKRLSEIFFNEKFSDLKDLCRRYQPYYEFDDTVTVNTLGKVFLKLPIRPCGLEPVITSEFFNSIRSGLIPTLLSGFRFFRGSLRFKFIIKAFIDDNQSQDPVEICITHVPDAVAGIDPKTTFTADDLSFNPEGYAYYIQSTGINTVFEIEVPYYKLSDFISSINLTKVMSEFSNLGYFDFSVVGRIMKPLKISIKAFYAFGDDSRCFDFQGFPDMVRTFDVPIYDKDDSKERSEKLVLPIFSSSRNAKLLVSRTSVETKQQKFDRMKKELMAVATDLGTSKTALAALDAKQEGVSEIVASKIADVTGKAVDEAVNKLDQATSKQQEILHENLKDVADHTSEKLKETAEEIQTSLWNRAKEMFASMGSHVTNAFSMVKEKIAIVMAQLVNILMSPNLSTIVIATMTVALTLNLVSGVSFAAISKAFMDTLSIALPWLGIKYTLKKDLEFACENEVLEAKYDCVKQRKEDYFHSKDKVVKQVKLALLNVSSEEHQPSTSGTQPQETEQESFNDDKFAAPLGAIATAMAAGMGVVVGKLTGVPNLSKDILTNMRHFSMTSNSLGLFFKGNLEWLGKLYEWVLLKVNGLTLDVTLIDQYDFIKKWIKDVSQVVHPAMYNVIENDYSLQCRVFKLQAQSQTLLALECESAAKTQLHFSIRHLINKLNDLCDRLVSNNYAAGVGYEPFVIQLVGSSGIGKSTLSTTIATEGLKKVNYKLSGSPMYARPQMSEYWNKVSKEPWIYYDDFLASMEQGKIEAREIMALKSPTVFNPNCAALPDKNRIINPLGVILCSNHVFFDNLVTGIPHIQALHRRRDQLWEVSQDPKSKRPDLGKGEKVSFHHLRFRLHSNPARTEGLECKWSEYMTYTKFLKEYTTAFYNYRLRALQVYRHHYDQLLSCMNYKPGMGEEDMDAYLEQRTYQAFKVFSEANIDTFVEKAFRLNDGGISCALGASIYEHVAENDIPNMVESCITDLKDLSSLVTTEEEETSLQSEGPVEANQEMDNDNIKIIHKDDEDDPIVLTDDEYESAIEDDCNHSKLKNLNPTDVLFFSSNGCITLEGPCFVNYREDGLYYQQSNVICSDKCTGDTGKCFFDTLDGKEWLERFWLRHAIPDVKNRGNIQSIFVPYRLWLKYGKNIEKDKLDPRFKTNEPSILPPKKELIIATKSKLEKIKDWKYFSWAKTILKWFGIILVGAAGVLAMFKIKNWYSNKEEQVNQEYSSYEGTKVSVKKGSSNLNTKKMMFKVNNTKSVKQESQGMDQMVNKIYRNQFQLSVKHRGCIKDTLSGVGLCGSYGLTVKHLMDSFRYYHKKNSDTFLVFKRQNVNILLGFGDLETFEVEGSSLSIIKFNRKVPAFSNILTHIAKEKDHDYAPSKMAAVEYCVTHHKIESIPVKSYLPVRCRGLVDSETQELKTETVVVEQTYSYPWGGYGKCGTPIVGNDQKPKIFAIHIAGDGNGTQGYAEPIWFERFECLNESVQEMLSYDPLPLLQDPPHTAMMNINPFPENLNVLGTFDTDLVPSHAIRTERIKTICFDKIWKHTTIPAPLSSKDYGLKERGVNPFTLALSKYSNLPKPFEKEILEKVVVVITQELCSNTHPLIANRDLTTLSDQEVFGGIPAFTEYRPLNLATSEGYPLNLVKGISWGDDENPLYYFRKNNIAGKRWLFKYRQEQDYAILEDIHPLLKDQMEKNNQLRKSAILPNSVFICTLKDACIPIEKAHAGKNRIFSNSPVEFTWAVRKYFSHFTSAYQHNRLKNGTAIGINTHGIEWTDLARRLLNHGNNIVTGDYKAFGDTLARECMEYTIQCINDWYTFHFADCETLEQDNKMRHILFIEMMRAPHLARNVLFSRNSGIPSGFALTVEINDLVNKIYIRYLWVKITNLPAGQFRRNCYLCTYGDDMILSVSDNLKEIFNFKTLKQAFGELNIEFTPASKDEKEYLYLPLSESTFLKGNFITHPTRPDQFLYKLPLASCLEVLNWQWKGNDKHSAFFEAARTAQLNLYGRGQDDFKLWTRKIHQYYSSVCDTEFFGETLDLHTWDDIDKSFFDL